MFQRLKTAQSVDFVMVLKDQIFPDVSYSPAPGMPGIHVPYFPFCFVSGYFKRTADIGQFSQTAAAGIHIGSRIDPEASLDSFYTRKSSGTVSTCPIEKVGAILYNEVPVDSFIVLKAIGIGEV